MEPVQARFEAAIELRQVSTSGGTWPVWNPAGGELFFLVSDSVLTAVDVATETDPVVVGPARPLFQTNLRDNAFYRNYGVGPDGERFLINALNEESRTPSLALVVGWPEELRNRQ